MKMCYICMSGMHVYNTLGAAALFKFFFFPIANENMLNQVQR